MSTSPRNPVKTAYHHGNLRAALLGAARDVIAESGIDGFGLREVSRRAGVSHTAAYNHFANRSALVSALVGEAFVALTAALAAADAAERDPVTRLQDVGVAYVRFAYEHPAEFRFMFRPELCEKTDVGLAAVSRGAYAVLERAIVRCVRGDRLHGDADTLALTAWSAVHGLASLVVDGPLRDEAFDIAAVERLAIGVACTLFGGDSLGAGRPVV